MKHIFIFFVLTGQCMGSVMSLESVEKLHMAIISLCRSSGVHGRCLGSVGFDSDTRELNFIGNAGSRRWAIRKSNDVGGIDPASELFRIELRKKATKESHAFVDDENNKFHIIFYDQKGVVSDRELQGFKMSPRKAVMKIKALIKSENVKSSPNKG